MAVFTLLTYATILVTGGRLRWHWGASLPAGIAESTLTDLPPFFSLHVAVHRSHTVMMAISGPAAGRAS
jgi:hypothetical protein